MEVNKILLAIAVVDKIAAKDNFAFITVALYVSITVFSSTQDLWHWE
jgi:hypothetical protein